MRNLNSPRQLGKVNYYRTMKKSRMVFVPALALLLTGIATPAQAKTMNSVSVGIKCVNKELVAGICLPKNRKKWARSYENNFILSCISSAVDAWAPDRAAAGPYCGCAIVEVEKMYTQSAMAKVEQQIVNTGVTPQKMINAMANCAQYLQ